MADMDHLPEALITNDPENRPLNIVISGTTMWNPGDDFVRQGVIEIVRDVFEARDLNLLFYNFSANVQAPHGQLGAIGNTVSRGDLEVLGESVDAVVIAGLSAGDEIKDLYRWIIDAKLTDRVYLIGAGYENEYVAAHCTQDPEATVFRDARVVVGRTEKIPQFLREIGTPYHHLACPSLLSVKQVRVPVPNSPVRSVGFSIQLPHGEGVLNQCTGVECSRLAMETMSDLARDYEITLIAHHKSEFLAFAPRFVGTRVKVVFESFVEDLEPIYRRLDLMVTTRLHAGLYANAHGIPALVINDTDRHTHAAALFPHAPCVADRASIDRELRRLLVADRAAIANHLQAQKDKLRRDYRTVLGPAFTGIEGKKREDLRRRAASAWGAPALKGRVLGTITKLTPDAWLDRNINDYREAARSQQTWFETLTVLSWWARAMRPAAYLEIGVRRGRSMSEVLRESPGTHAFGFDLWIADYASDPAQGIVAENPGPEFVREEIERIGGAAPARLVVGSSHQTVPAFFAEPDTPEQIDLILVDGDHSDDGARRDLQLAFERVAPGGAIIFDDLVHGSHPGLRLVWESFRSERPDWLFVENHSRSGTGVAIRPPFDRLRTKLQESGPHHRSQELARTVPGSEPGAERLVRRLVTEGMTVLDVGAHAGRYTHLASLLVGESGRVLSIDASPNTADRLRARVRAQRLDNVAVEQVAISDHQGTATLHEFGEHFSSWSSLGTPVYERTPGKNSETVSVHSEVMVPLTRLDELCDAYGIDRVDYLKLDVEGAEPAAIRGMGRLLSESRVQFVQFEVSGVTIEGMGAQAAEIFEELDRYGYRCHTITEGGGVGDEVRGSHAVHSQYIAIAPSASLRAHPADRSTPIHFFTIVLNGMPFLDHHAEVFAQLDGPWHWHIVEGVGTHAHDTSWCADHGGAVTDDLHRAGRSNDGTSEAIDRLVEKFPNNITVYRKPPGVFWDGKLEMVNAPLENIHESCLLWQVDVDELWTLGQIRAARMMFAERPQARAAYYRCHYFVGPDRVVTSRDTYGNHSSYEWLRTWRFTPGCRWLAHEPPRLGVPNSRGGFSEVSNMHPIMHEETERRGLVFQHFAYALDSQLEFKERYYGYAGAVSEWRRLQACRDLPLRLRDYFSWVEDDAIVERAESAGITPLLRLDAPVAPDLHGTDQACGVS